MCRGRGAPVPEGKVDRVPLVGLALLVRPVLRVPSPPRGLPQAHR